MSRGRKITIAGGGVLGWTIALALADAGDAEVLLCDPGGSNASSIAGGMLAPVFEAALDATSRPQLDLLLAARDLWPGLAARTGVDLDRAGALAVGSDAWLERLSSACLAMGERLTELGPAAARGLAPGLSDGVRRALLTREDWRVDAPAALSAIRQAALATGVRHLSKAMTARGDEDVLVVATGASRDLAGAAPELRHLSPIKGHIVRVEAEAAGAVVRGEGVYAAPGGGGMAFGATMERGVSDPHVDPSLAAPLLEAGLRLFPGLRDAPTQVAAGVRASTPDGLPLVGWSEAEPGVVLAAGGRRNGWLLAPLVAQIVTTCVTGHRRPRYAERMDPARFRESLWS